MSQARMASRTKFQRGVSAVFTTIPEIARVNFPDIRVDLQDTTSHDSLSVFREYMPGLKDGDTVTAECVAWVPWNPVHYAMRVDQAAATKRTYRLALPYDLAGEDNACDFDAYLASIASTMNVGEAIKAVISAKVTGALTYLNVPLDEALTMVSPSSVDVGDTVTLTLFGDNTNWVQGDSIVSFSGAGITINSTTVQSGSVIEVNITVSGGATPGARNVTVTTDAEVVTLAGGLTLV